MLDNLGYRPTGSGVEIGVYGKDAPKADGHVNFSGKSQIPTRRFIPGEGQQFRPEIDREIQDIVNDHIARSRKPTRAELGVIRSKSELNTFIRGLFPDMSLSAAKSSILRDNELADLFGEFSLLRFF
jgi:hypothetical protein